jgi:hypothetical protein
MHRTRLILNTILGILWMAELQLQDTLHSSEHLNSTTSAETFQNFINIVVDIEVL